MMLLGIIFVGGFVLDVLHTHLMRQIAAGNRMTSAILSFVLTFVGVTASVTIIQHAEKLGYTGALALALGAALGTALSTAKGKLSKS